MKTNIQLGICLLFLLLLLEPLASTPDPGLMILPYYKKQKARMARQQRVELERRCRNARSMDPDCVRFYAAASTGRAKAGVITPLSLAHTLAPTAALTLLLRHHWWQ